MTPREAISDIKKLISEGGGDFDHETTRRYRMALASLRHQLPEYSAIKITEVELWLNIYFSQRKHQKYPGGLPQIQIWILTALSILEGHINNGE